MNDSDSEFMLQALDAALNSKKEGDVPFGAIIVHQGKVITTSSNSEHVDQDVTHHAELKAISEASHILGTRNLSDCTIYSTVEPCPMCAGAIFNSCVKRVVYGMSRDDLTHLFRTRNIRLWHLADDYRYNPEIVGGVLKEEVIKTFLEYKQPFRVAPIPA
jgi:tRNA(Arg) A34 adenosine deaminase TadA